MGPKSYEPILASRMLSRMAGAVSTPPTAAMVMSVGPVVVVVVDGVVVGVVGCGRGRSVVVVVVSRPGMVAATTTVGGTVTVTPAWPSTAGWVSSAGRNISGAQRAITARTAPKAFSALRMPAL